MNTETMFHEVSFSDIPQTLSASVCSEKERLTRMLTDTQLTLSSSERTIIDKIEAVRCYLINQQTPLFDGSLGPVGAVDAKATVHSACKASKGYKECLMLYRLIRTFKPRVVLELGTNIGISSAYQAAALRANGQHGRLITMEGSPYRLRFAKHLHQTLGLDNISYVPGLFYETLDKTLADCGTIDFAFIDGHHQYQPTLDYYREIWKYASPSALFVFDDIRWSDGMKNAWSEIQQDKRFSLALDMQTMGVCIRSHQTGGAYYTTEPLSKKAVSEIGGRAMF